MSKKSTIMKLIENNKRLFIIIGICLFLIEMEIFAVAILKSGNQSKIVVINDKNDVIYEADGSNLTDFNKYYFEKNFGSLDQYDVKLQSKHVPFPFRAWFTAAFGVPVGIVLLIAFIFKAVATLLGEDDKSSSADKKPPDNQTAIEGLLYRLNDINVFIVGTIIFICVLGYWIIPNFIAYIGEVGAQTILRFKWFFLVGSILLFGIFIWVIYLRYLLATKTIESKTEIEKQKLKLTYQGDMEAAKQIAWESKDEPENKKTGDSNDTIEASIVSEN